MQAIKYFVLLFVLVGSPLAWADGAGDAPAPGENPALTQGRELVSKKDWSGAIKVLDDFTRANPGSADGFNLLGYSLRHLKRYDESLAAYKKALTIDPKHRGAHEYIGEAYIQLGQLDNAKKHLDALDKICFFPCEEYTDLKKAYEAARKGKSG